MGVPEVLEARPFYRSAKQRFEDARFLLKADRTTGAMYLAGYCVECVLKALVLSILPQKHRHQMREEFRGAQAHNFDWLRARYMENGGSRFPIDIVEAFSVVNTWSTDLRYEPGLVAHRDVEMFLKSVETIILWADARM